MLSLKRTRCIALFRELLISRLTVVCNRFIFDMNSISNDELIIVL